ncbi:MAG: hypothetical protein ACI31G_00360 [Bacilli bacterium]
MNKKLGIILLFVGAYVILLGGLFWNMSIDAMGTEYSAKIQPYDWFWGLSAGIVVACGAALALKKNFLCLVGVFISVLGFAYSIGILVVGLVKIGYFSVWILIGAILTIIGAMITTLFYFVERARIEKYGKTLL